MAESSGASECLNLKYISYGSPGAGARCRDGEMTRYCPSDGARGAGVPTAWDAHESVGPISPVCTTVDFDPKAVADSVVQCAVVTAEPDGDRKSTRLNSS